MNFIERLKPYNTEDTRKAIEYLKHIGFYNEATYGRMTEGLNIGDYHVSIQASYGHHCTPSITTDYGLYTHMEMAVISMNNEFVDISTFKDFHRLEELVKQSDTSVCHFVPIDLIQDFVDYLEGE